MGTSSALSIIQLFLGSPVSICLDGDQGKALLFLCLRRDPSIEVVQTDHAEDRRMNCVPVHCIRLSRCNEQTEEMWRKLWTYETKEGFRITEVADLQSASSSYGQREE